MNVRLKRIILLTLAALMLCGISRVQVSLNRDRERLGLTQMAVLENAPPVLAFTTVALGGFRGLIANFLWIRASDMQMDDKVFEAVQLADWITKLEPHYSQVWVHQAWNMAYNISVKFSDFKDRWNWVQRGVELLRDEGLKYNPNDILIHRELGWIFQHKMGYNMDDAHFYYKKAWFDDMSQVFNGPRPNFEEFINPQTEDAKARAKLLREKYKMDPKFMKEVDEKYGPLEWRLPEASAVYWAAQGLQKAAENPLQVNKDDFIMLRRVVYQSLQQSVLHGRVIAAPASMPLDLAPNLDILTPTSKAYEQAIQEDEKNRGNITRAYRYLLGNAVYFLYTYNREREAAQWFEYLQKQFPNDPLINGTRMMPGSMTLDDYCIARLQEEVGDVSRDRIKLVLEGLIRTEFYDLAIGDDDKAIGLENFARKLRARYAEKTEVSGGRVALPPVAEIKQDVLKRVLDPETGFNPELAAVLRTKLNLPAPTNTPPAVANP